ncbi:MAG TPA: serine/threonine-protein kinase, partial [Ktedonobacterales bacterium]|nr:serine/threonine-protein kinase [Ktedonobacterales bacterium]
HPRGIPLPVGIVVRYAQQVAEALDYAHQQKIIHRNVKPENLLVGKKNEILLSDFGIAIVTHQAPATTAEDSGDTLSYIAPEQLRRRPHPASDQYALAVMVYEWLTGRLPFQGSALDVARQHLEVPPPPMREPGSAFSADVERVVLRGLEKHWQMRYPGAREFANALHDAHFPRLPFTRVYE